MRFLDVKTDFAFKKVFGSEQSKNVLISFLNAIIDFGEERVTDLTIVDPYQIPLLKGMKDSYVDVKAVLSNQSKVIVEMQVLNVEGFEKRVLYNAAKLYSTQLKKSGKYTTLEPIIALTLTDFEMFPEFAKTISYWNLREREVLLQYSNDIELIFAELPKFTKTEEELSSITEKWLYFVKHAGEMEFVPESFTEPQLLEAFDIANTAGLSEEELEIQFRQEDFIAMQQGALEKAVKDGFALGIKQGLQQRREQGVELSKIEIARNMLRDQMPIERVCKYIGLEREVVEQLQQEDQE
ncbi:Rpn family recombination-promoting nuclease/putative transposase [Candidatus Electrothrix laxa]